MHFKVFLPIFIFSLFFLTKNVRGQDFPFTFDDSTSQVCTISIDIGFGEEYLQIIPVDMVLWKETLSEFEPAEDRDSYRFIIRLEIFRDIVYPIAVDTNGNFRDSNHDVVLSALFMSAGYRFVNPIDKPKDQKFRASILFWIKPAS
jgi:hypothetical protein